MKVLSVKFVTRTAILLALVVVFQMVGRILPAGTNNFIVGPLVNACLIVATAIGGLWSGIIVSILSPYTSLINNHAPIASALFFFAPFIAAGNSILVVSYYLLAKKSKIAGIVAGALLKFGFLYGSIVVFLKLFSFPKFANILSGLFSWPQLVTALVGGALALAVMEALPKDVENDCRTE